MLAAPRLVARSAACVLAASGCGGTEMDTGGADGGVVADRDAGDGNGGAGEAGPDAGSPHANPTFAPTFSAIYREVFATRSCNLGLCHGEGARGGGVSLHPRDEAYRLLVGVASTSSGCAELGLALVEPGDPGSSLLFLKLAAEPPCGVLMPPDGPLVPAQIEQIRGWIAGGAADD